MRWVVVGAGSAGIVAATRLSEDPANDVVLVEAGPDEPLEPSDDFFRALRAPGRTFDGLEVVSVAGRAARPYLRGRGVGGSGAVNAMVAPPGGPYADVAHLLHTEVADERELGSVDRALLAAAPDAALVALTRREGRRTTAGEAYLDPVRDRPNLRVRADVTVDRVLFDGRRAVGVRIDAGQEIAADRVVLAAGAIHSPSILLRSGVDTPGVGDGVQDHPSAPILLALRPEAVARPGSLAVATLLQRGDVHVLPMNHLGDGGPYGLLMPALMRPRSTGRIRLASDDPSDHPVVELGMLGDPADVARLVDGVQLAIELLGRPAFAEIVDEAYVDAHGTPVAALSSPDEIADWLPDHVGDYAHLTSSCAMGRVVDDDGAVVGYESLHVCDASVFPRVPAVNPHLATIRLAEHFVRRWAHGAAIAG